MQVIAAIASAVLLLTGSTHAPLAAGAQPTKTWLCVVLPISMFCG